MNALALKYYEQGFNDLEVTGYRQGLNDYNERSIPVTGVGFDTAVAAYAKAMTVTEPVGLQSTAGPLEFFVGLGAVKLFQLGVGAAVAAQSLGKYEVGSYLNLRAGAQGGLNAHHVGQKAVMKKFIPNYNPNTAPSILVPKVGHTIRGPRGIINRSTDGFQNARQVLARDIRELRRVYPDVPNSRLKELLELNRNMYSEYLTK